MSSYNAVNGVAATENELLENPLNSAWGFDGIVVSDRSAIRSAAAANASKDLEMPGPQGAWGPALVAAVQAGQVPESAIDRKVHRILRFAARVGALEGFEPVSATPSHLEDGVSFAREAAAEGAVLVRNKGLLPLDPAAISTIAVVGHRAYQARTQGGGSATALPEHVVSPVEGIRAAFSGATVEHEVGFVLDEAGSAAVHVR